MNTKTLRTIRMTSAEFAALGSGYILPDNYEIVITDPVAGSPDIYRGVGTGIINAVTQASSGSTVSGGGGLKKVGLIGSGVIALNYTSHNGAEVHAESGVTGCSMLATDFSSLTGSFYLFNYTGGNLPLTLGAGWSGGVSEDGETTNDLAGAGTLITIPHARKAFIIFDADGWVRATLMGVEVTQVELDTKMDLWQLGHPFMTATTLQGFKVTASSEHSAPYLGWKSFQETSSGSSEWATAAQTTGTLTLELPQPVIFTRFTAKGRTAGIEYPTRWKLQGSTDGTTFTDLLDKTAADESLQAQKTFAFPNLTPYRYYRFNFTASAGTNPGLSVCRWYHSGINLLPSLGTSAWLNVAASGDAATGDIVKGNDTRLTNSRTPSAHTHVIADTTSLQTSLDAKAATSHTHTIANVTSLQTSLDAKAATSHTHAIADTTGLQTSLDAKAATSHTHAIADTTGLQTALDTKASTASVAPAINISNSITTTAMTIHPENFTSGTATGTAGTYTVTASSEFNATYAGWKAFDGNDTTDWATLTVTSNFWVRLQLSVARVVTSVVVRGRASGTERPTSWRIEGSNDGATFTTLHSSTTALGNIAQTFAFTNTTSYLYYRFFAVTGEASNPGLSRISFRGESYAFNNPVV